MMPRRLAARRFFGSLLRGPYSAINNLHLPSANMSFAG
jgi:hypothetical protein